MTFRELHHGGDLPLLLPNAWDVASALAFLDAGFPAIGTTSFGVGAGSGRPDGGRATQEATLLLARQLSPLPAYVSADIEDGYSDDPEQVADYAEAVDADGINIEDSTAGKLIDPELHAAKIRAVKRRVPGMFVNARVDTYWLGQDNTVRSSLRRAEAYVRAGADGIFLPGAAAPAEILELTSGIPVPVNVLVVPGLSLTALGDLGVRRVSTGSLPYRAALDAAAGVARAVREGREVRAATPYGDMQDRLTRYQELLRP